MFTLSSIGRSPNGDTSKPPASFAEQAQSLLRRAMPPTLVDDRFDERWQTSTVENPTYRAVLAYRAGETADNNESGNTKNVELAGLAESWREPNGALRQEILLEDGLDGPGGVRLGRDMLHLLTIEEEPVQSGPVQSEPVELWTRPATPTTDHLATEELDARLSRHLFQMRRASPPTSPISASESTRGYEPKDRASIVNINNRAFVDHPDQGSMTPERFAALTDQPWFDPQGLRLLWREDRLAAFCWTKIHTEPPVGEIYVVGVDPDFQGQGLGAVVTEAGLSYLKSKKQTEVMLYVEATNTPAVAVYTKLGFATVREDKAWTFLSSATAATTTTGITDVSSR